MVNLSKPDVEGEDRVYECVDEDVQLRPEEGPDRLEFASFCSVGG